MGECGGCRFEGFNAPYVRTLATVGPAYLLVVELHLIEPFLCVEML